MPIDVTHAALIAPPEEAVLWRFMSITKFLAMLNENALAFIDLQTLALRDPMEGSLTNVDQALHNAIQQRDEVALLIAKGVIAEELPNEERIKQLRNISDFITRNVEKSMNSVFVNCWHLSKYEPAGFWSQYASEHEGISIKSSLKKMKNAFLNTDQKIYLGLINYYDYNMDQIKSNNALNYAFSKRREFEHEKETRLCISDWDRGDHSPVRLVKCRLGELIEEVIIAPFCDDWVLKTVTDTLKKFGVDAQVKRSTLVDTKSGISESLSDLVLE